MSSKSQILGLVFGVLSSACDQVPIRVHFVSEGVAARKEGRGFADAEATSAEPGEPATQPSSDAGAGFVIGPRCPSFPEPCELEGTPRCSLVNNNPGFRAACVSGGGEQQVGEGCERGERGDDDCASGAFCTLIGVAFEAPEELLCRQLCSNSPDCGTGGRCIQLTGEQGLGLCVEECGLFSEDCGQGSLRCAVARDVEREYFGYCERFGAQLEGGECVTSAQCARDFGCELSSGTCRQVCDEAHPCPEDRRCLPLALGNVDSPSLCLP